MAVESGVDTDLRRALRSDDGWLYSKPRVRLAFLLVPTVVVLRDRDVPFTSRLNSELGDEPSSASAVESEGEVVVCSSGGGAYGRGSTSDSGTEEGGSLSLLARGDRGRFGVLPS